MREAALVLSIVIAAGSIGRADARMASAIHTMQLVDMNGSEWTAARLRGRVTLIDFWATWCAPCLTELPYLKQARARYGRDEFEVLGVSFDVSDRRALVSWLNRHAVTWPQVFDGRGRTGPAARHFGVSAVPTSFLIGTDGALVAMNLRGERLLQAIDVQVRELRRNRLR